MLFQRQVSVAFVKENVFPNEVSFGEALIDVTELERDLLMYVASVSVFVNPRLVLSQPIFDGRDRLQPFILDLDEIERIEGGVFIDAGDGGNRISDEANFVDAQRVFVLTNGQDAVRYGQVLAGDDCDHSG